MSLQFGGNGYTTVQSRDMSMVVVCSLGHTHRQSISAIFWQMDFVKSEQVALPPKSAVRYCKTEQSISYTMEFAYNGSFLADTYFREFDYLSEVS